VVKENYPESIEFKPYEYKSTMPTYICHCDDVTLDEILEAIGDRKFIPSMKSNILPALEWEPAGKTLCQAAETNLAGSGIRS